MRTNIMKTFSSAAAVWLALSGLIAVGCQQNQEPDAVEVSRDAEGDPQIHVDGDQVDKNLEQAGDELKAGAREVQEAVNEAGEALERGADRIEAEVGPVVQDVLDDAAITTRVKARLVADPDVNAFHIDVDTVDGRVTLNGKVATEHQKQEASELADRTEGVREVVNLIQVAGQDEGAAIMGLGHTLMEKMILDASGRILNMGAVDYRILTHMDVPEVMISDSIENADGPGPFGIKGVSEGGLLATSPAVATSRMSSRSATQAASRHGRLPMVSFISARVRNTRSKVAGTVSKKTDYVVAGHDPRDSTSAALPVPDYAAALKSDLKGLTLGVVRESLARAEANVRDVGERFDAGLIPPNEVASAEAQASDVRQGHAGVGARQAEHLNSAVVARATPPVDAVTTPAWSGPSMLFQAMRLFSRTKTMPSCTWSMTARRVLPIHGPPADSMKSYHLQILAASH